ncbi:hypothetical protein OQA88_8706 [Cercophora sp. LCS_1]
MAHGNVPSGSRRSQIRSFISSAPHRLKSLIVTKAKGLASPRSSSPIQKGDHRLKPILTEAGEASSKVAGRGPSGETAAILLPTASLGWRGLEEVKSRCSGRICLPTPSTNFQRRPSKLENDTALFEFDLFYVLTLEQFAAPLPSEVFQDMDQAARELLAALDTLVACGPMSRMRQDQNQVLCGLQLHNLNSLLCFLDAHDKSPQFTLITNPSTALFQLPEGEIGAVARDRLKKWKQISEQLSADLDVARNVPQQPQQPIGSLALEPKEADEAVDKRASSLVSQMFDQFRRLDCARPGTDYTRQGTHELRLRVSEELYAGPPKPSLDMFTLCDAIRRAIEKRQRLHLQVGPKGLFDMTEEVQAEQLESDNFDGEPLRDFLERQAFTPIRPRDVFDNTAQGKFRYHEKVEMALVLSKCLVDFFDEDFELPWTPSHIHLRRTPTPPKGTCGKNRYDLYVSFRPETSEVKTLDLSTGLAAGNPMLLSFAKLLLEIDSGDEIPIKIDPEPRSNMAALGKLIEYLDMRESETENPGYLRAVRGCLFAGTALHVQTEGDHADQASATRTLVRKELNEKIVMQLEQIHGPQSRLLQDQPSEHVKSKDVGVHEAPQLTGTSNTAVSLYDDQEEESKENRRRAKDYFNYLRGAFEPLRNCNPAIRPIRIAVIDSGIDMNDPVVRAKANQIKGKRNWTTLNPDDCDDAYGHGTHVARLLVTVAPTSEIFIAKISTGKQLDHKDTDRIAQAIDWAAVQWDVDIISLSLGLDTENERIKRALDRVINPERGGGSKKIVIAAAANWGGNQGIAFPGRHKGVICVHSTDGMGNPSETNPTAQKGKSLATLGLSVESSVKKKGGKGRDKVFISGTSYATPIAAGIAANVLEFASRQLHNRLSPGERENLFAYWGMSRLFEKMSEPRSGYDYIVPWKLFDGREPLKIAEDIHVILRGTD